MPLSRSAKRCVLFCPERQLAVPPTDSRMLTARRFSLSARSGCAASGGAGKVRGKDGFAK